ncbi:MAG: sugar ABC transporter permease [Bacillota bacterium]|nr:MAG: sugar ABC transporter permease [Bacillota bacterium]
MVFIKRFFTNLKKTISQSFNTFQEANLYGKLALISSTFLMAGDFFFHRFFKGILKLFFHLIIIYFMFSIGFRFLFNVSSFRSLNVQLYSFLILILWLYLYIKNLNYTLRRVQTEDYGDGQFKSRLSSYFTQRKHAFIDYKNLFKESTTSQKIDLISPFILLGYYQIKHKAYVKGFLLLSVQVLFIVYLMTLGIYDMIDFFALDTSHLPPEFIRPSTFNLVYGLLAFFVTCVFLYIYKRNILTVTIYVKDKVYAIKPFLLELKALKDHKLYISLLTFPILGILGFTILPLLFMILIAFTSYQGSGQHFIWSGLDVFKDLLLISDNLYTLISVIEWTLIWAFFATFTNYFGGIFLASLINKKGIKGKKVWRTIFIITMATPQFVSLLIMNQMFASNGPVNQFLMNIGLIDLGINFWGDQTTARILIIVINMWIGIPYLMLLTSGILMNIPEELYEAAVIEGANKRQLFMKITMPYMLFITAPLLVTGFIHNINNFNVIYLLTQGKPLGVGLVNAGGTDILITWLYKLTSTYRLYNLSAAIGIIIFVISASFSLVIYRRTASYKREGEFS